jgi:hypothetical protein
VPDGAERGGQTGVAKRSRTGGQTGPDGGQTRCPTGGQMGWPDGVARRRARQGRTGCPRGGQAGCLDGVPDGPDGMADRRIIYF